MSGARNGRTSDALHWGVALAAAVMLLACAPAALAAPPSPDLRKDLCYLQMKSFMAQYSDSGFAPAVSAGNAKTYETMLDGVKLVVDPNLPRSDDGTQPLATWNPETRTIAFLSDPLQQLDQVALGETVWHEVTHAIESDNGDDAADKPQNVDYYERNVSYMAQVRRGALPILVSLEKMAKEGASAAKLAIKWKAYLNTMAAAADTGPTRAYPPDLALMQGWFGFRARPNDVLALYLTGKAFSGKKWANLRKALKMGTPAGNAAVSTLETPDGTSIKPDGKGTVRLVVRTFDAQGNKLGWGGAKVTITKSSGAGTVGAVVDSGNGTYIATVTSPTTAGSGDFVATLDGAPVKSGTGSQTRVKITYAFTSWDGVWGTDIGYIKLTQSGGSVTGFFGTVESSESWRLEGTPSVDGLTLTGRVIVDQRTDHDQLFVVAMQPDWQAFAGVRWYASNPGFTVSFEGRRQ